MVTDVVQAAEWQSFTILYENPEWLPHLSNLLELYDPKGDIVTVKRIDIGLSPKNYRSILRETKMSPDNCIIIECSIESLEEILKQVRREKSFWKNLEHNVIHLWNIYYWNRPNKSVYWSINIRLFWRI